MEAKKETGAHRRSGLNHADSIEESVNVRSLRERDSEGTTGAPWARPTGFALLQIAKIALRDLSLDLDAIRDWGAAAVVTLVEPKELIMLRVEHLGDEVLRRGMSWFHLPIVDVSTPSEAFERQWDVAGNELRTLLRNSRDVLVHCRGGLGRAGTIAARLLVELGTEPQTAIRQVRAARPGAIETPEQERYVLGMRVVT